MSLKILYQDANILAVYKPPLLASVSLKNNQDSVESLIKTNFKEDKFINLPTNEAGLVNRLDFETSGIILSALNQKTKDELRELFRANKIKKEYQALVEGKLKKQVRLENYIGGRYRGSKQVSVYEEMASRSQKAISVFSLLNYNEEKDVSLIKIDLITGVRHQIRAHAKYLKHPLVGDVLYGSTTNIKEKEFNCISPFYLECCALSFILDSKEISVSL